MFSLGGDGDGLDAVRAKDYRCRGYEAAHHLDDGDDDGDGCALHVHAYDCDGLHHDEHTLELSGLPVLVAQVLLGLEGFVS